MKLKAAYFGSKRITKIIFGDYQVIIDSDYDKAYIEPISLHSNSDDTTNISLMITLPLSSSDAEIVSDSSASAESSQVIKSQISGDASQSSSASLTPGIVIRANKGTGVASGETIESLILLPVKLYSFDAAHEADSVSAVTSMTVKSESQDTIGGQAIASAVKPLSAKLGKNESETANDNCAEIYLANAVKKGAAASAFECENAVISQKESARNTANEHMCQNESVDFELWHRWFYIDNVGDLVIIQSFDYSVSAANIINLN